MVGPLFRRATIGEFENGVGILPMSALPSAGTEGVEPPAGVWYVRS
jgi:hypothetical protein